MMLIVALTAATGFLTSVLLLSGGVHSMLLRYPLAVVAAYVAFLFFLWCWLKLRWEDFVHVPDATGVSGSSGDRMLPWAGGGGLSGGGGASGSWDGSAASLADTSSSGSSDVLSNVGDASRCSSPRQARRCTTMRPKRSRSGR
jgi:hypothetical protein